MLICGAVLAANLLTVSFVYGVVVYMRREKEGRARNEYLVPVAVPMAFLLAGVLMLF